MPLDEDGREIPDPIPFELDVSIDSPLSLNEKIKRMLQAELRMAVDHGVFETEEEAQDFDVNEEPVDFGRTIYEMADEIPLKGDEDYVSDERSSNAERDINERESEDSGESGEEKSGSDVTTEQNEGTD